MVYVFIRSLKKIIYGKGEDKWLWKNTVKWNEVQVKLSTQENEICAVWENYKINSWEESTIVFVSCNEQIMIDNYEQNKSRVILEIKWNRRVLSIKTYIDKCWNSY